MLAEKKIIQNNHLLFVAYLVTVDFVSIFEGKNSTQWDSNAITNNSQCKSITDHWTQQWNSGRHRSLQTTMWRRDTDDYMNMKMYYDAVYDFVVTYLEFCTVVFVLQSSVLDSPWWDFSNYFNFVFGLQIHLPWHHSSNNNLYTQTRLKL